MSYTVDRTAQLETANLRSRFGQKASLQAQGVPTKQHNVNVTSKAAKKTTAKKTAKKSSAKKAAKKTAKKS